MKIIRTSGSLKFSSLSLLAAISLLGNPVTAAEPESDAQAQARQLLSGRSRDLTAPSVAGAAIAATPTDGRPDAQSQARAVLAPNAEGLRHSVSSNVSATTVPVFESPGAGKFARNQPDAQEAARRLLGTGQAVLN